MFLTYNGVKYDLEYFETYLQGHEYMTFLNWQNSAEYRKRVIFDRFVHFAVAHGMVTD